jgi:hypothetical protein
MLEGVRTVGTGHLDRKRPTGARTGICGLAALVVAVGLTTGIAAAASASDPLVRPHQFAVGISTKGLKALGAVPAAQSVPVSVVLPPSNSAALSALVANLYNPNSSQYHQWLKPGAYASEFGPSPSTVAAVESWLHGKGLAASGLSGSMINVSASAGAVSKAFGVSLQRYLTPSGRRGYVAQQAPLVPQSLADGQIQSIVGLNTVSTFQPEVIREKGAMQSRAGGGLTPHDDGLTPCAGAVTAADNNNFWTLDQLGGTYGLNDLLSHGENGTGQTVGIFELASHSPSDIGTYQSCFGLQNPVSTVPVDGGGGTIGGANADGTFEADLDIEQVATQSPGASIISYEGPNTDVGAIDVMGSMVSHDTAQVLTTSWGECEPAALADGSMAALHQEFIQAAAQGQSVFAATGDSGSEDCFAQTFGDDTQLNTDYPSTDPKVTAVGGTLEFGLGDEQAWNYCQGMENLACADGLFGFGAGGGGLSDFQPRPTGQPTIRPISSSCANECRETPDVSANAGIGMVEYDNGTWDVGEGTSFASPLWAGLQADRNQGCTGGSSGVVTAALYSLYNAGGGSGAQAYGGNAFSDVTGGDNDLTGSNGGDYAATSGYDLATGIGSPEAAGLSCPEVYGVSENEFSGETTISGLGLKDATITFNGTNATVVDSTNSSAIVVVPPGSGSVTVKATGILGAGVSTATYQYPTTTSAPTAGVLNTAYTDTLTATGGTAPYTWAITSGSLPMGLHLQGSTGKISGTPTVIGTSDFTASVTDHGGVSTSSNLSIQVFEFGSVTTETTNPISTPVGGSVTYSATVAAVSGSEVPTGVVTFSVGSTTLCTTSGLSAGVASCSATTAPTGADTVTASYPGDTDFAPSTDTAALAVTSGPYSPLPPTRICDTRPVSGFTGSNQCDDAGNKTLAAGVPLTIDVAGSFGVPADATAVVLNVTVVNPVANGFLTVFPTGQTAPNASNVNYEAGEAVPNLVEVGTGSGGQISFTSSAQTDLVVDLEGFTSPTELDGAGLYNALPAPARLCDSRPVSSFTAVNQCNTGPNAGLTHVNGGSVDVSVTSGTSIPSGATAAVLNVTVVNPLGAGFLTVYPQGGIRPTASNVNYAPGRATTNRVIVPLSGGKVTVYDSALTDVIVDISGYYSAASGTGSEFTAESAPVRICDTRPLTTFSPANQCTNDPIGPGQTLNADGSGNLTVAGLVAGAGVPANATAVVLDVAGIIPTQSTFLSVLPHGSNATTSDLNLSAGENRANLVVATVNPGTGTISIFNQSGSVNVIVDVLGWYSASSG